MHMFAQRRHVRKNPYTSEKQNTKEQKEGIQIKQCCQYQRQPKLLIAVCKSNKRQETKESWSGFGQWQWGQSCGGEMSMSRGLGSWFCHRACAGDDGVVSDAQKLCKKNKLSHCTAYRAHDRTPTTAHPQLKRRVEKPLLHALQSHTPNPKPTKCHRKIAAHPEGQFSIWLNLGFTLLGRFSFSTCTVSN